MDCKEMSEHLMDAAAGLPPAPQVATHLRSCAACSRMLDEMRRTVALLDEWQAPEPSPYFDVRLRARLREEAARPRGGLEWFRRPALAAALAVLLVIGGTLYTTGRHPQTPRPTAGSAVQDLQELDRNQQLFSDFDLLDELGGGNNNAQTVNP